MKSILSVLFLFVSLSCSGQYSELKKKYNYKDYTPHQTDKYSPAFAGVMSAVIPGSGQMYCGEPKRAAMYFGGCVLGTVAILTTYREDKVYKYYGGSTPIAATIAISGTIIFFYSYVGSIINAPRVAKVKNLASQGKLVIAPSSEGVGIAINF